MIKNYLATLSYLLELFDSPKNEEMLILSQR